MSIGGGKGSSSQSTSSPAANTLANLATKFEGETSGIRTGLIDVMQEVLSTGGSSLPIISRSVEASKKAGSNALSGVSETLGQMGLAGTPEGESIRAGVRGESEIAAGQTEQGLAQMIFQMIPNLVLGQAQTALSGLSGAIPGMNKTSGQETAAAFGSTPNFGK